MASYSFHLMLASLHIEDTPISYRAPRGPSTDFKVVYNQREANQPATFPYSNLGPKWTFNWLSYVTDGGPGSPAANPSVYVRGGGTEVYGGYDAGTGSYAPDKQARAVLLRNPDGTYERRFPDGSKEIFTVSDQATSQPRRVFLSSVKDAAGNAVTLTYDTSFRITTISDSLNQPTTLEYPTSGDTTKIKKVTDPFGRFAQIEYNGDGGQLSKIIDPEGIQSEFFYTSGTHFINRMLTPYGETLFTTDDPTGETNNSVRWVEARDPLLGRERVEYNNSTPTAEVPSTETPAPADVYNAQLNTRNTYYWDKKAMAEAPNNRAKAQRIHWLLMSDGKVSGIKASEKKALENRVWYTFGGQSDPTQVGSTSLPTGIARVLGDGTTQLTENAYNAFGNVTQTKDPVGRVTDFEYFAGGIDLKAVYQRHPASEGDPGGESDYPPGLQSDKIAGYAYDYPQHPHRRSSETDAAGQPTTYTYTTDHQLDTVTNAKNEVTKYLYGPPAANVPLGYLASITRSFNGIPSTTSFQYDTTANRVSRQTESDGYFRTFSYDNLDRQTQILYPDQTSEQYDYTQDFGEGGGIVKILDLTRSKDRLGRWTTRHYDKARRMDSMTDPENRTTLYNWCSCGSLDSITDPADDPLVVGDHKTTFIRDIQGRVTRKQYADGSSIDYLYEGQTGGPNTAGATSRVASMTDAKNQRTNYRYFNDDTVAQITYTDTTGAPLYPVTPTVTYAYDPNYKRMTYMSDGTGSAIYSYHPVTLAGTLGANQLRDVDGPLPDDTITFGYDALGRTLSQSINGVASSVTYDSLGRMSASDNDVLGHFTRTYQGATGRPLSVVAAQNGQITNYHYLSGSADRRLDYMQNLKAGGENLSRFDYTYDPEGEILSWSKTLGTNAATALWFGYDNAQQLKVARNTANSNISTYENAFAYDLAGNRTSDAVFNPQLQFPNGTGHTYTPNSLNQLADVMTIVNGTPVESEPLLYDLNGNMTYNVANQTYEWDAANRLTAINYPSTGKRSEFTYDGANRRIKIVEKGAGQTAVAQPGDVNYSDYASAPFAAPAGNYTISFEGLSPTNYIALIDAVKLNNVLAPNGSFETPVVGPNAVVNPAGATWTFAGEAGIAGNGSLTEVDAPLGVQAGFIRGDGVIRQTVTLPAGNYTLAFKAAQSSLNKGVQQLRVTIEKTGLPTSVQRFVYNGNTIAEERDSTGATVTKRFFAEGEWRLNSKGDGKYYYTRDHLGSIREVTNSSGVLQARYDYDLWGNSVVVNGTMSLDFGFTGYYFHSPSGLNLTLHRMYIPSLGRWGSRDPLENAERLQGPNLYGYVENDPVNATDPLGLMTDRELGDALNRELNPLYNLTPGCEAALRELAEALAVLAAEFAKYNPVTDWIGGHPHKYGTTTSGGHAIELQNKMRRVERAIRRVKQECRNCSGGTPLLSPSGLMEMMRAVPVR